MKISSTTDWVEHWNDLLAQASRRTIGDYQNTLIKAVYALDESSYSSLNADINDIAWAKKVIDARRKK